MRLLFVKHTLGWPRATGHDVHGYYMMQSLAAAGHAVALATVTEAAAAATAGAGLRNTYVLADFASGDAARGTRLQERFRRYYGVKPSHIRAVGTLARDLRADAVVAVGLEVLPYLMDVHASSRVWYAADEWLWHHVSQLRLAQPRSWHHATDGIIKGFYERAYRGVVDIAWVVSDSDRRAMRLIAGIRDIAVIPNGVDTELYTPHAATELQYSAAFWGRLDFGPNVDALRWFCSQIWPAVRTTIHPDARLTVIGYQPSQAVRRLAEIDGIELKADVEDLPHEACRHQVAIMPFVSGGGIKNKLLEAAALRRAILCSPVAARGLKYGARSPFLVANTRVEWIDALRRLWKDERLRTDLGQTAREWVKAYHNWPATAAKAVESLTRGPRQTQSVR